uniref:Carbonic anhydrase 4 n=1 Tax=Monodelphis domestica TaxID=13616 RepID=F6Z111_MONDO
MHSLPPLTNTVFSLSFLDDWCYSSQAKVLNCSGPELWPATCKGFKQSPVNIVISNALSDPRLKVNFKYIDYDGQHPWTIVNNGYTSELFLSISGGGLEDTYRAMYVQFHWSDSLRKGSEHTINGKTYPMEGNMYCICTWVHSEGSRDSFPNVILTSPLDLLSPLDNKVTTKPMSLYDLIPDLKNMTKFFRYEGSLTSPSCPENVIWTVYKDPLQVKEEQILQFSKKLFYNEKGKTDIPMANNYRKMQRRGHRHIYSNRVGRLLPHTWSVFLTPLLTCFLAIFLCWEFWMWNL